MDYSHLEILLKEVNLVSKEFKTAQKKTKFNIFTIIRKGHEEVGLHSKFLFELLSPDGSHGKKDIFLKLFLKQLKVDLAIENAQVFCEKDNIDLLIKNRSQAIIIENKIYAEDQSQQLSRYYNTLIDKGSKDIHMLYLSLDGKRASQQSIEELPEEVIKNRLINKSYKGFIIPWLTLCLKECATEPQLRETIVQYQNLLKQLTMSNDVKERKELLSVLANGNNMEQAEYLVSNWNHMKWHTEMDFWNDLLSHKPDTLKQYDLVNWFLFDEDFLNGTVHSKRNRDFQYGIAIKLFDYEDEEICFMIERGDDSLDYGIVVNYESKDKKEWLIKKTDFVPYLQKTISEEHIGDLSSPWLHWKYPKQDIDFERFDNAVTLSLANPEKREAIVKALWLEATDYINKVLDWKGIKK